MNYLLKEIIEQTVRERGIKKYTLSNQYYLLMNSATENLNTFNKDDQTISFNIEYNPLTPGIKPKAIEIDLGSNLLFVYEMNAVFIDYKSEISIKSQNNRVMYSFNKNTKTTFTEFGDEYILESQLVTVHERKLSITGKFAQEKMAKASLVAVLLKPEY